MSTSIGQPAASSTGALPFLAAKYAKRAVAIRRDPDYDTVVASLQKVFPALAKTPTSRIVISAVFPECGDLLVEINRNLWSDVISRINIVAISVDEEREGYSPSTDSIAADLNNLAISRPISIDVQCDSKTYPLTIPCDSTIQHLKAVIQAEIPLLSPRLISSTQGFSFLDNDKTLKHYKIKAGSVISIITNIRVYVTTPLRGKIPIMATLYANVSSLRLVISSRADVSYPECSLTCDGDLLDDSNRLDSYPQIVPECEIMVSTKEGLFFLKPFTLRIQPQWAQDDEEKYTVWPKTTVLDIKVLQYNVNLISPDRQLLTLKGKELQNEQIVKDLGVKDGDMLVMKMRS